MTPHADGVGRADKRLRAREQHIFQSARVNLLRHPAVADAVVPGAAPPNSSLSEVIEASAARLAAARPALRSLFDDLIKKNGVATRAGTARAQGEALGGAAAAAQELSRRGKPRDTGRSLRSMGGGLLVQEEGAADVTRDDLVNMAERWPAKGSVADTESSRAVEKELKGVREGQREALLLREGRDGRRETVGGREGRKLRSRTAKEKEDEEIVRKVRAEALQGVRGPVAAAMVRAHVAADRAITTLPVERKGRRKGPGVSAIEVGVLVSGGKEVRSKNGKRGAGASCCCFCPDPALFGGVELTSELLGPFVNPKGQSKLNAHFECACWAPQVYVDSKSSRFQHVYDEYMRGRHLRCAGCAGRGATVGCYVSKCKKTFHLRCLGKAGARKVEKYFVSFCATHRHLADTTGYKLMMEAGSIADVASVIGRDSTQGLDTPHSKYTQLRRGQTEVVFSARARLSSHIGPFDTGRVLFATRRREIVPLNQRIAAIKDRPRRIRVSALDVANGRLAHLNIEARVAASSSSGATGAEAEAEVAAIKRSEKLSPLFLLRNLEKAPDWSPGEIDVVKVGNGKTPSKRPSSGARDRTSAAKKRRLGNGEAGGDCGYDEDGSREVGAGGRRSVPLSAGRRSGRGSSVLGKRPLVLGVPAEGLDDENGVGVEKSRPVILRLPLRREGNVFVAERRAMEEKEDMAEKERRGIQMRKTREREERAARRQEREAVLRRKREAEQTAFCDTDPARSPVRQPVIKTAWQIFLDEQLPKERSLRPDDDPKVSMRNMARLWGLLEPLERAVYEEKTKVARLGFGLSPFGNKNEEGGSDAVAAAEAAAVAAHEATQKIRGAPRTSRLESRVDVPTGATQQGASGSAVRPQRMSTRRSKGHENFAASAPAAVRKTSADIPTPRKGSTRNERDATRADTGDDDDDDDEEDHHAFEVGFFAKQPSRGAGPEKGESLPHRAAASVSLPARDTRRRKSARHSREDLESIFPDALSGDESGKSSPVKPPPSRSRRRSTRTQR